MKTIFIIWLAFTVVTYLFGVFGNIIATQRYEKKHPNEKIPRLPFTDLQASADSFPCRN